MTMNWQLSIALIACLVVLVGCAHTGAGYRPLVDTQGVDMNLYERDLRDCQGYAQQTANAAQGAVVGAVVGAALGALLAGAEEKTVGVWCGYTGQRLTELMRKTVLNPQWSADKPKQKDFTAKDDFNSCSAVIFMLGFGKPVWRDWKPAQIAAAAQTANRVKRVRKNMAKLLVEGGGTVKN